MNMAAMAIDRFCLSGYDVVTVSTTVLPLCGTSTTFGVKGEGGVGEKALCMRRMDPR